MSSEEFITESLFEGFKSILSIKVIFGLIVLIILFSTAILAPVISPFDPNEQRLNEAYKPPFWVKGGDKKYILGTDSLGRDIFSRLVYGARVAAVVAIVATILTAITGILVGLLSGFFGGKVDQVFMRLVDIWMSFPPVLFALALIAILGVGLKNVILAIAIIDWTRFARVVRAEVINIKEKDFILADKAVGMSNTHIIFKEILPNTIPIIIILATLEMSIAITVEILLSYVGLGVKAFTPSWGSMISEGLAYFRIGWWGMLFPMLATIVVILGLNSLGDGLREKIDPRLSLMR